MEISGDREPGGARQVARGILEPTASHRRLAFHRADRTHGPRPGGYRRLGFPLGRGAAKRPRGRGSAQRHDHRIRRTHES